MATEQKADAAKLDRLNANLARIEELSQRLVAAMARRRPMDPGLQGPGQEFYLKAAAAFMAGMAQDPARMLEHQVGYWSRAVKHFVAAQHKLAQGRLDPPEDESPRDDRFADPLWESHPYFNFIKQQYQLGTEAMTRSIDTFETLDARDRRRLEYFVRQMADMLAPTNFLATNPEALARAVQTEGESLVRGLENLVSDLEANDGELLVTLADPGAFTVGRNLATTPGAVVLRNRMIELIQYAPTTETVHKVPLVIFPPWINKFYILDLKPANSLIRWLVEQGHTVFVVSWVNPDPGYRDVGMDDYAREGYLAAIEAARAICGVEKVNAVGYCIAGTTLAAVLAAMRRKKLDLVNTASFFTTLTDFSDQGEVGVFLDDDFVDGIEREVDRHGILSSFYMARTFSYLRSNDLIYRPAIRNYMLGEPPPAFDLLYWNGDGTNLPARMAMEYLRALCQEDQLAQGGFSILGETVRLRDITQPVFTVACETDHIANWRSSMRGIARFGSRSKTFVLSRSGHIAGIVNPPAKRKYGYYTGGSDLRDPDAWLAAAEGHEGSWWPAWQQWLSRRAGARVAARALGDSAHPVLSSAPGDYVAASNRPAIPEA